MELTGIEEITYIWAAGKPDGITIRHPVEMISNPEANATRYVCRNGINVMIRSSWDVCIVVPTVLVEQEVCKEGGA